MLLLFIIMAVIIVIKYVYFTFHALYGALSVLYWNCSTIYVYIYISVCMHVIVQCLRFCFCKIKYGEKSIIFADAVEAR